MVHKHYLLLALIVPASAVNVHGFVKKDADEKKAAATRKLAFAGFTLGDSESDDGEANTDTGGEAASRCFDGGGSCSSCCGGCKPVTKEDGVSTMSLVVPWLRISFSANENCVCLEDTVSDDKLNILFELTAKDDCANVVREGALWVQINGGDGVDALHVNNAGSDNLKPITSMALHGEAQDDYLTSRGIGAVYFNGGNGPDEYNSCLENSEYPLSNESNDGVLYPLSCQKNAPSPAPTATNVPTTPKTPKPTLVPTVTAVPTNESPSPAPTTYFPPPICDISAQCYWSDQCPGEQSCWNPHGYTHGCCGIGPTTREPTLVPTQGPTPPP